MTTNDPADAARPRQPARSKAASVLSTLGRPLKLWVIVVAGAALAGSLRRSADRRGASERREGGTRRRRRPGPKALAGSSSPAREEGGAVTDPDGSSENLARREADVALAEALFDQSPDVQVVYRVDPDGFPRLLRCNAAAARVLGWPSSESLRGRSVDEVFPLRSATWIKSDLTQAVSSGGPVRRVAEEVRPDGTRRVWDDVSVPLGGATSAEGFLVLCTSRDITAVGRTDPEKNEANSLLRLAESVAHVGHWRIDEPGGDLFWSEEVFRMSGIAPGACRPTVAAAIERFHPDDRDLLRDQLDVARGNGVVDVTARLIRPDGEVRHVVLRGFRQSTDATDGCPLFGVIMDVTELRRAEARLRDNVLTLKVTLDNMDQGLMMVDVDGRVSICNQRALDLLDLPAALMASQPRFGEVMAYQARHGDFEELPDDMRRRLEANALSADFSSYERKRPNGIVLDIRTALLPAGGAVLTFTDVTANRQAERALRATEARYRLLADNASDLVVLGHANGRRSYISPAVKGLLGFTVAEAHGVKLRDWLHPDDIAHVRAATNALTPEEPGNAATFRLRHKDGSYIWAEAAFRRVEGEGDAFTIVTAIRDVTERQLRTEELRVARDAAERARNVAESANRAKTDFLATMSHEVRTPLNSIIGFSDLLATAPHLPPDLKRYVDLVRLSGSDLLTIVNDILDFSQVEAGAIELLETPFDPATLVDDCLSIARGSAISKALVIDAVCDPDLPRVVVGDEGRLRQILLNLLNNAVRFTRQGSIRLTLRRGGADPAGEALRFSVADTGIGIPADKQHRLFQRFSQVDGSIRRDFGGTGLGLAICKGLVELMGGEIGVVSEHGQGATFWFEVTLPRSPSDSSHRAGAHRPASGKRGRLLLVEDIAVNQELAKLILETEGHRVDVVSDGAAAVAAVQDRPYDLVLMDLQMPGMDGITATQFIRKLQPPVNRIPILAMTANVLPDQLRLIQQAGMDGHVGKPINRDELFSTIDRWLPERSSSQDGEPQADADAPGDGRRTPPSKLAASPEAWIAPAGAENGSSLPADDHGPPAFDRATYDNLIALLGAETVAHLAGKLNEELLTRFAALDETRRDVHGLGLHGLRHDAHATMPAAGMLGLMALSLACASLQEQEYDGDGGVQAIAALRARRAEAFPILARLRDDGPRSTAPGPTTMVH